jgi:hypothetical protein
MSTSDAWFEHSGSVRVSGKWVRVVAPGRPAALVPIDLQGTRYRDRFDDSPVFVTVVMNQTLQTGAMITTNDDLK